MIKLIVGRYLAEGKVGTADLVQLDVVVGDNMAPNIGDTCYVIVTSKQALLVSYTAPSV